WRLGLLPAAWLAGAALLIVAIQLQRQLWLAPSPRELSPLWYLLGVAVAFAVIAPLDPRSVSTLGHGSLPEASDGGLQPPRSVSDRGPRGARAGWLRLGMAVICEAVALWLFWREDQVTLAWVLHLSASTIFVLGAW